MQYLKSHILHCAVINLVDPGDEDALSLKEIGQVADNREISSWVYKALRGELTW